MQQPEVPAGEPSQNKALERPWPNTLRSGVRQGSALRSDRYAARKGRTALTDALRCGYWLVMRERRRASG